MLRANYFDNEQVEAIIHDYRNAGLEPEEVAQVILNMVNHPRREVIIPWQMRFTVWMNSFFPGIVDWIIENRFTRLERDI